MHHVPVNLLQMESRIEQAKTIPLLCQSDLVSCMSLIQNMTSQKQEIKPTPLSQEIHRAGSRQCDKTQFFLYSSKHASSTPEHDHALKNHHAHFTVFNPNFLSKSH